MLLSLSVFLLLLKVLIISTVSIVGIKRLCVSMNDEWKTRLRL